MIGGHVLSISNGLKRGLEKGVLFNWKNNEAKSYILTAKSCYPSGY